LQIGYGKTAMEATELCYTESKQQKQILKDKSLINVVFCFSKLIMKVLLLFLCFLNLFSSKTKAATLHIET